MRCSIISTWLLASLALATPVDKRHLTTEVEVVTVWTTVIKGALEITPATDTTHRHHRQSPSPVNQSPADFTSSAVVVPPAPTAKEALPPAAAVQSPYEAAPSPSDANIYVSPSAPAPAPSSTSPSSGTLPDYAQKMLDHHNIHRANHTDTGPLTWSNELGATALKIANSCIWQHDTETDKSQYNDGYGQNLGAHSDLEHVYAQITDMYNSEAPLYQGLYGQASPDMTNFHEWGHFTQMVWQKTQQVGCATVKCSSLKGVASTVPLHFTVCNFDPPGNYADQYTNVGNPLGKAAVAG